VLAGRGQRVRQGARVRRVHAPLAPVLRDRFEMAKTREDGSR
jgi:hypothetical protein